MTTNATNEQMAEIMGWTLAKGGVYYTADERLVGFFQIGSGFKFEAEWNPVTRLDHAALVEQHLRALGLGQSYIEAVLFHTGDPRSMTDAFNLLLFASAQTRCNAAWQVWQARTPEQPGAAEARAG